MNTRTCLAAIALLFASVAYSQEFQWKIVDTEIYDSITKESIPSPIRGIIKLNTVNKTIWLIEQNGDNWRGSNMDISCCRKIIEGPHEIGYELVYYLNNKPTQTVALSYCDDGRYQNKFEGILIWYFADSIKIYHIIKGSSPKSATDFLTSFDSAMSGIHFDWIAAGGDDGSGAFFIQDKPISDISSDGKGRIWVKQFRRKYTLNNVTYENIEIKTPMEFDCTQKRIFMPKYIFYDSHGAYISTMDLTKTGWIDAVPGSVGELLLNKVCSLFYNK